MSLSQIHQMKTQNHTLHIMIYQASDEKTVQNQATNANQNIAECNNKVDDDECDMSNADIENQMDAST